MAYNVTLIPGDGTGPELSTATRRVLEATGAEFNWEIVHAGADVMDQYGTPLGEKRQPPEKSTSQLEPPASLPLELAVTVGVKFFGPRSHIPLRTMS